MAAIQLEQGVHWVGAKELVDSRAIVLGGPTVVGGLHPAAAYAALLIRALNPPAQRAGLLSSYGWGSGAGRPAQELLQGTKLELAGAVEAHGAPTPEHYTQVRKLAEALTRGWQ